MDCFWKYLLKTGDSQVKLNRCSWMNRYEKKSANGGGFVFLLFSWLICFLYCCPGSPSGWPPVVHKLKYLWNEVLFDKLPVV